MALLLVKSRANDEFLEAEKRSFSRVSFSTPTALIVYLRELLAE
jgi:hypothetical protein